ncbi:MAG: methyl-accepting chemotaxis protein [Candidatus Riflebacteria bacterium]|nr:methyl-accepting chemotaxis protein [Candidatus Riflebacteria bacterium]
MNLKRRLGVIFALFSAVILLLGIIGSFIPNSHLILLLLFLFGNGMFLASANFTLSKSFSEIAELSKRVNLEVDDKDGKFVSSEFQELQPLCEKIGTNNSSWRQFLDEIKNFSKQIKEGNISARLESAKHTGFPKLISEEINNAAESIMKPFGIALEYTENMSKGITPPVLNIELPGSYGQLKKNLNSYIETIGILVEEIGVVISAGRDGKLKQRANADRSQGVFRKCLRGVNDAIEAITKQLTNLANSVSLIAKGKLPEIAKDKLPGDYDEIKNNLNNCIEDISSLINDTRFLAQSAQEGKLDYRADASKHHGDWGKVIEGVNKALDAIINPLKLSTNFIDKISKGIIPPKISENYPGDFNTIKNSINLLIDSNISITKAAQEISRGNLTISIKERSSDDELMRALSIMVKELGTITKAAQEISQGNLTVTLKERSPEDELMRALSLMVKDLGKMISDIKSGVQTLVSSSEGLSAISIQMNDKTQSVSHQITSVASASSQMTSNATNVAAKMDQTNANLSSVATATEEMTATIGEIAGNSEKARAITNNAVEQTNEVSRIMKELGNAAMEIGKFTETITSISSQTNMLALNATIEAARAGAAGKGFAVVANEIKELAKQAAAATEDIKTRIAGIQTSTSSATNDIERIIKIIKEVSEIVSSIATAIEEQASVTKEIAGNIAQASDSVNHSNESIIQTNTVIKSTGKEIASISSTANELGVVGKSVNLSSTELSKLADSLKNLIMRFRI